MHTPEVSSRPRQLALFALAMLPALLWALYTNHGWEDWYITFRAAKNLAMGNGLVYTPGQVLQTFTSPFNVLLPALLSWLTGNTHDALVLWLYRVIGAGLLAGTVLNLDRLARLQGLARPALWFLLAFFMIDGKIIDFSINGQEAAFLVFFLSLTLVALLERRPVLLGVAWAGFMWSRPDSFIYIGGVCCGYLLHLALTERSELVPALKRFVLAGLVALPLYGPWIIWTTWYYGSPISHTIVAKGLHHQPVIADILNGLWVLPLNGLLGMQGSAVTHLMVLNSLFMPSEYAFGGWPVWLQSVSRLLGFVAIMAWVLPRATLLVRTASLACFIGAFYLQYIAYYPCAWYFPSCILLAMVTLAGLLHMGLTALAAQPLPHRLLIAGAAAVVLLWTGVSLAMAWEMRIQQALIETNHRKLIGQWLHDHAASPHDTVFLECLGYIGFYSNLKMYDYPGMSSPEMVAAREQHGESAMTLIRALRPDWLVLRDFEAKYIFGFAPGLVPPYEQVARFDQSQAVASVGFLPGRNYLQYDQTFLVFHRVGAPAPKP